ncbi:MAG: hypothetical protein JRI49_02600, partial [Deltaproteobacteria bacterium]|nr:hypothetical protein [Deltaproteobacteria bacterium]
KKRDFKAYGIDLRFEDKVLQKIAEKAFCQNTGARGLVSVVEKVLMKFEKKLPSTDIKRLLVTKEMIEDPVEELNAFLENPEDQKLRKRYDRVVEQEKIKQKTYIEEQKRNFPEEYRALLEGPRLNLIVERVVNAGIEMSVVLEEILSMDKAVRGCERKFFEESGVKIMFEERAVDKLLERALEEGAPVEDLCGTILKNYYHGLKLIREKSGKNEFILTIEAIKDPEAFLDALIKESYEK